MGTAASDAGIPVCGTLPGDTSWTLEGSPYILTCDVTVPAGITLDVQPGTEVRAQSDVLLIVGGVLRAAGSAGAPVLITADAAAPQPGYWRSILVQASGEVELDYTHVEYGGTASLGALQVEGGRAVMRQSAIRHSLGAGLISDTEITLVSNLFEQNGEHAVRLQIAEPGTGTLQVQGNSGSGNGTNGILLAASLQTATLAPNPNLPYVVDWLIVEPGGTLTVQPGTVFKAARDVAGYAAYIVVRGALQALGTADQPITFTSLYDTTVGGQTLPGQGLRTPQPGDWRGLATEVVQQTPFRTFLPLTLVRAAPGTHAEPSPALARVAGASAVSPRVILDHVRVRYGGYGTLANVRTADAELTISNSEIAHSLGQGVRFDGNSSLLAPILVSNTLAANLDVAASLRFGPNAAGTFVSRNNSGQQNGTNGIRIEATIGSMTLDANPGLPYVVRWLQVGHNQTVALAPGTVLKALTQHSQDGGKVVVDGTLQALGQPDQPVVFTSLRDDAYGGDTNGDGAGSLPSPDDWRGVLVNPSGAAHLDHTVIQYGGYDHANLTVLGGELELEAGLVRHSANHGVYVEDSSPKITGTAISHSQGRGLMIYGRTQPMGPELVANQFHHNGTFGAYLIFDGGSLDATHLEGNQAWDNGAVNGLFVEGSITSPGLTWESNPGAPYVVWGLTIQPQAGLHLQPGTEVKFTAPSFQRGPGVLTNRGTLHASGTLAGPVSLTSFFDDSIGGDTNADGAASFPLPGDWVGLVLEPGSTTVLDHTAVHYAGAQGAAVQADNAQLTLASTQVSHSAHSGLSLLSETTALAIHVTQSTFDSNVGSAMQLRLLAAAGNGLEVWGNTGVGNGSNGIGLAGTLASTTRSHRPARYPWHRGRCSRRETVWDS
jgi:hypothetical protein